MQKKILLACVLYILAGFAKTTSSPHYTNAHFWLVNHLFNRNLDTIPLPLQRVLIDVGGTENYGGTLTVSPSLNGNTWNNMTDARPGVRITNALTTNNQLTGISVEVINRIDGTYGLNGLGMGNGNTVGVVGDYPASATTDHALIHISATNGKWKIKGLQADKTYTIKFWGARSNTTAARNAEIKRADETVWKSYSATGNTNYNNAAVFSITGKTEMEFDIRTKAGSDFSALNVIDISYQDSSTNPPPPINLPPVAKAGNDTTIQLPTDSVMLRGCASYDPELGVIKYKWRKISGPVNYILLVDSLCSVKVKGLVTGIYTFELTVTDTAGLTGKDSVRITVNSVVPTNWPPQVTPLCNKPYKIVVVGSSTAYGTGANPIDSSWARKFNAYLLIQNTQIQVINIATLGLTSWDVSPTGTIVPSPFTVDTLRNITKALSYKPDAVILNLPSNDVARGIATSDIHANFLRITALADAARVPIWVTTTQPRDGLSPSERILQMDLRDWINTSYGNKSVDFWSTVANPDGTINTFYSAGDGVHLNNYGHHILFTRIVEEKIWDTVCKRINLPPVARAGNDTTIQLPTDSVMLRGCASYDPELGVIKYKWRKISGPVNYILPFDSLCSVKVKGLITGIYTFELTVTDTAGLTGKDSVRITVNSVVPTNWPPQVTPLCNKPYKIVVVGSSTAYGTGANPIDSSWARKFNAYLLIQNTQIQVINIATLGLTSWEVSPTGTIVPSPFTVDTLRNITKALSYNPDAIILNLPSNDVARGIPTDSIHKNYNRIAAAANGRNIPLWVTTTQPRDGLSPAERILQMELRDWINSTYGNKSVDFWSTVANPDGTINTFYSAGDGVHLNNFGHHVLFTRIVEEKIWDTICKRTNLPPVAKAGNDIYVINTPAAISLNGSASFDPEGTAISFSWRILNNSNGILTAPNTVNPVFTTSIIGNYKIELKVTDIQGLTGLDTLSLFINAPNIPPIANAGFDIILLQTTDSVQLNGTSSFDTDGSIIKYKWKKISGPAVVIVNDSISRPWLKNFSLGTYLFSLTVTDDSLAVNSDTVSLLVNAVPVAFAGVDQTITLPATIVNLNGSTSYDSDGSIVKYRWKKISSTGNVNINDSTAIQPTISFVLAGQYFFELAVTDNLGAVGKDTVMITVNPDPNIAPIANAGTDQIITLPNNTATLNGSISIDNDGSISFYKWRKIIGSNVVISDSIAVISNVTFVSAGQYLFELAVTDNLGVVGKDTVKITVNPDPNTAPIANAGPDKSITFPVNKVFLDGRSSYDPEAGVISFSWQFVNGPTGSSLLSASKDTTSISFINSGTYTFKLTVTDAGGLSAIDNVTVIVLPVPDVTKRIKVNIYGGTNPYTNPQWNNWNIASGITSQKFYYEDAVISNVNASITASALVADNGANYASSATVCPPAVLRYNSANTSNRTLTFSGFNVSKKYNFEFYASRSNTGNSSVYSIGSKSDTISTSSNVNDYAKFINISPDNTGKISVNISRIGTWTYLAGFMITEQDATATLISMDNNRTNSITDEATRISSTNGGVAPMVIHPNPAKEKIYIRIPDEIEGKYSLSIIDITGKNLWQKTGTKNWGPYSEAIDIKGLHKGMYMLQLTSQQQKINQTFIKL